MSLRSATVRRTRVSATYEENVSLSEVPPPKVLHATWDPLQLRKSRTSLAAPGFLPPGGRQPLGLCHWSWSQV